jgi:hypothetical protein
MLSKKTLVWILISLSLITFLFSMRTPDNQLFYTFIALGIWGVSFVVNKYYNPNS